MIPILMQDETTVGFLKEAMSCVVTEERNGVFELEKHYADKLFETTVSRNVKLSEAPSFGAPVYYHEKRSKGAVEYLNIAKELAERI